MSSRPSKTKCSRRPGDQSSQGETGADREGDGEDRGSDELRHPEAGGAAQDGRLTGQTTATATTTATL